MPDLECRVAKLEAHLENNLQDCEDFHEGVRATLRDLTTAINDLKLQREKQISFLGGIAAVVSVIATVAGFVINKYF